LLVLAFVGLLFLPVSRAEISKEYQLKAAFLYNFTKFVEWPPRCFANATSPITIAILGDNPFADELETAVRGRQVNGRSVVVKEIDSIAQAGDAQVLFIAAKNEARLGDALGSLQQTGVLTVGESRQFAAMGGIITFTLQTDKVRFQINQQASEQAGLKINAQLLKLATVVHSKP
jgi:hypothetical protein